MSGKSYVWLNEEHTQVSEYTDPPEPTVIVIADLEASIADLAQQIVDLEAVQKTDAEVVAEVKTFVANGNTLDEIAEYVDEAQSEFRRVEQQLAALGALKDQYQALLDTINAEAT